MCDICFSKKKTPIKYCCSNMCNSCFLKLKGICPVCERDQLNIYINCEKCENKNYFIDIDSCDTCKKNVCNQCAYFKNKYILLCSKKCNFRFINDLYNNKSKLFSINFKCLNVSK